MSEQKRIGRRIAALRKAAFMSQTELAEVAEIGQPAVSMIEAGTRGVSLECAGRIAQALGVTLSGLLSRDPTYKLYRRLSNKARRELRIASARGEAQKILDIICGVENRCLAADGPVTPTLQEMTEGEMREIGKAAKRCVNLCKAKP